MAQDGPKMAKHGRVKSEKIAAITVGFLSIERASTKKTLLPCKSLYQCTSSSHRQYRLSGWPDKKRPKIANTVFHLSFMIHHSSFIIHHASLIIHQSSFIHHSSFLIHHSSFLVHHLSFIIHHSSFIIPALHDFLPASSNRMDLYERTMAAESPHKQSRDP